MEEANLSPGSSVPYSLAQWTLPSRGLQRIKLLRTSKIFPRQMRSRHQRAGDSRKFICHRFNIRQILEQKTNKYGSRSSFWNERTRTDTKCRSIVS